MSTARGPCSRAIFCFERRFLSPLKNKKTRTDTRYRNFTKFSTGWSHLRSSIRAKFGMRDDETCGLHLPTKFHQFRFIVSALWRKPQILPRIVLLLQTLKIWGNPSQVSTAITLKPIADNRQVLAVWPTMKVYTNSENLVKKLPNGFLIFGPTPEAMQRWW